MKDYIVTVNISKTFIIPVTAENKPDAIREAQEYINNEIDLSEDTFDERYIVKVKK